MRIFAAVSNTFFPVYFQRYDRCSAGISFLSSCFRKEIPMCSMKLEYLVNGKVTAYLKASKYSAAREDATGFVAPAPRSYFFPLSPASHTYAILHNNLLCSSFDASLSCRFLHLLHIAYFHLYPTRYAVFPIYSCFHFFCFYSFFSIRPLCTCWCIKRDMLECKRM